MHCVRDTHTHTFCVYLAKRCADKRLGLSDPIFHHCRSKYMFAHALSTHPPARTHSPNWYWWQFSTYAQAHSVLKNSFRLCYFSDDFHSARSYFVFFSHSLFRFSISVGRVVRSVGVALAFLFYFVAILCWGQQRTMNLKGAAPTRMHLKGPSTQHKNKWYASCSRAVNRKKISFCGADEKWRQITCKQIPAQNYTDNTESRRKYINLVMRASVYAVARISTPFIANALNYANRQLNCNQCCCRRRRCRRRHHHHYRRRRPGCTLLTSRTKQIQPSKDH